MKISVVCVCVFLFCTIYWAFGLSQILTSAENEIPSTTTSASILLPDINTSSTVSDSDGYQTVLNSEGDLEYKADFSQKEVVESVTEEENQQQEYAFIDVLSQNSGVAHEAIGPSPGFIQTLVDSKILEKTEASNSADTITSHHNKTPHLENVSLDEKPLNIDTLQSQTEKKQNLTVEVNMDPEEEIISSNISDNTQQTDNIGTEVPTVEPKSNVTADEDKAQEDIPSFSEWTQKQLKEAEKKKEEANSSTQNQQVNGKSSSNIRKRWKNYASPDCGAKIIAANPESNSAGSVLTASRDEYKLNACTNRIWFIVELCEAIQAKKIELANFELFSSSPKDFGIFVSDRFPTRDWLSVGQFTAKDERDIQHFDLYPHLFGKYIKFEMYSHHGSEHYCPISLFRVFGTSEFEVLETENQVHDNVSEEEDDDDDEPINIDSGETPKNLFSSATDAVISIVKKAAEVLGNKGNASSNGKIQENVTTAKYSPLISTCTTPSHIVVCDNCSDLLFGNVFELLSCSSKELVLLVSQPIIKTVLYNTDVCSPFGLEFCAKSACSVPNPYKSYVSSLFPPKLIAALCNVVAINEYKVVRNISSNATTIASQQSNDSKLLDTKMVNLTIGEEDENVVGIVNTENNYNSATQPESTFSETTYTSQIKPTKTLTTDIKHVSINVTPNVESLTKDNEIVRPTTSTSIHSANDTTAIPQNKTTTQQMEHIEVSSEVVSDIEATESTEHLDLDNLVTDLNEETANVASTTLSPPTLPQGQKESVFLRLSNRIKALERNMSLSSQYLEELSRRYKKQVEEMQRLLDKTINTFNEENKKKEERSQHLEEQIVLLRESIDSLIEDKKAWMNTTYWLFLSGVTIVGILLFCRRNQEFNPSGNKSRANNGQIWRRMSVDVITNKNPVKKRRPSEEALLIGGTYTDLMIDEVDSNHKLKRRKRKRKSLQRSNSIPTLSEEAADYCDNTNRTVHSEKEFRFIPITTSSQIWRRPEVSPPDVSSLHWVENIANNQNAPLALDESEHSCLDPLVYNTEFPKSNFTNGEKVNNGDISSSTYIVTATDSRAKRFLQRHKGSISKVNEGHKKSLSFDESTKGTISSLAMTDTTSLTNSIDESTNKIIELPKKEKKNTLKRLFKSLNFK